MTLTDEQYDRIDAFLATHRLPSGLGTKDEACSVAAINLALTGTLTDTIPECMSEVVGRWIITIQDIMPDALRNSADWKILLPSAAGTGREREQERADILLDWMWGTVLPTLQPIADECGFGAEWRTMCEQRTSAGAAGAARAARAAWAAEAAEAAWAAEAARAAAGAARAARAAGAAFWETVDPCSLLAKLISVG